MLPSPKRIIPPACCAALLAFLAFPLTSSSQTGKHGISTSSSHSKYGLDIQGPIPPMPLIAPLFIQTDQIDSNITVVNVATKDVQGQITLRDGQGGIVGQQSVLFPMHSSTVILMKTLLAQTGSQAHSGSVTLQQDENVEGMALAAQLSMTLHAGSQSSFLEEEFGMPTPHASTSMHAVASQTRNLPVVAVTSTIDAPQTITATCLGQTTPSTFDVPAYGTAVVQACSWNPLPDALLNLTSNLLSGTAAQETDHAIALRSDSVSGSFYAFGFSINADLAQPELQPLDFYDPSEQQSSSIVYAGIPIGSTSLFPSLIGSPVVTVANFSAQARAVTVDLASSVTGTPQRTRLSQLTVPANGTTTVKLAVPSANTLLNSFTITSDGAPGDIEAHLFSPVANSHQRLELLAKDMRDLRNGGGHPWSIEGGNRSTLLLYNTTDQQQQFQVHISDPKSTWVELYKLAPYETKAVSINDIVTKGTADHKGTKLPPDIQAGDIQWWTELGGTGLGRLLETNTAQSLARSFSCGNNYNMCNPSFGFNNFENILLGNQADLFTVSAYLCTQIYPNQCSGGTQTSYSLGYTTNWTNNSPSIVSSAGSSQTDGYFNAISVGSFAVSAQVSAGSCLSGSMGGGGTVQPSVSIAGPSTISKGQYSVLTATGTPAGGTYAWATSTTNITLSSTTGSQIGITGDTAGQALLTVSYTLPSSEQTQVGQAQQLMTVTASPSCPTSVTLSSLSTESITLAPTLRTGIGASSGMLLGPSSIDFSSSSSLINETITQTSDTCPGNINPFPSQSNVYGNFAVGQPVVPADWRLMPSYPTYPGTYNTFYDEHYDDHTTSLLSTGSCKATAVQYYLCNGTKFGTFQLTKTYTFQTVNGNPVTTVTVTEQ